MGTIQQRRRRHGPPTITADVVAIGRRIRELRGFDLTQAQFAKVLDVGQTQLSRYELGQSAPTLDVLLKLSAYSGKTIDWIVTGKDSGGT